MKKSLIQLTLGLLAILACTTSLASYSAIYYIKKPNEPRSYTNGYACKQIFVLTSTNTNNDKIIFTCPHKSPVVYSTDFSASCILASTETVSIQIASADFENGFEGNVYADPIDENCQY